MSDIMDDLTESRTPARIDNAKEAVDVIDLLWSTFEHLDEQPKDHEMWVEEYGWVIEHAVKRVKMLREWASELDE